MTSKDKSKYLANQKNKMNSVVLHAGYSRICYESFLVVAECQVTHYKLPHHVTFSRCSKRYHVDELFNIAL